MAKQLKNICSEYSANVSEAMLLELIKSLGLEKIGSTKALEELGIGFLPAENSWVVPEFTDSGKISCLTKRDHITGAKYVIKGGKRGVVYIPQQGVELAPPSPPLQRTRVREGLLCPLCGKPDWCVIFGDIYDPNAILCPRTEIGAAKYLGDAGYLHILKEDKVDPIDNAVLIVEGFSDWYTATSLGFDAYGRSNALSSMKKFIPQLYGKTVIIIGEPDKAGIKGMETIFLELHESCDAIKILPPQGIKDLRSWYKKSGVTKNQLLTYVYKHGNNEVPTDIFDNREPITVAKAWLKDMHTTDGTINIRNFMGSWYTYRQGYYHSFTPDRLRGELYGYLEGRKYQEEKADGSLKLTNLIATRNVVSDIIDAANYVCAIENDPPFCLNGWGDGVNPTNLIVFKNGILNVSDFISGNNKLIPHSPSFFNLSAIPHVYKPEARSRMLVPLIEDILSKDQEKIALLQEWFGYNITADQRFEAFMMFVGLPRAGKGVVMDMLTAMLGRDQCSITSFSDLVHRFGFQDLLGKLSVQLRDASLGKTTDATQALEKLKTISGGDPVGVNRKFLTKLSNVQLRCRFTIAVNTLPELPDSSKALESRLLLLPFSDCYVGRENRDLKEIISSNEAELEGLLVWALEGLQRLRRNKKFTIPAASEPLVREFRALTTPVQEFVEECCTTGNFRSRVSQEDLFNCWRGWCRDCGQPAGSKTKLTQHLIALYPQIKRSKIRSGIDKVLSYRGIGLRKEARETYLSEGF